MVKKILNTKSLDLLPVRPVTEHDFYPPTTAESVYLIVYTDRADLGGFTDVIHPARLDAKGVVITCLKRKIFLYQKR